MKVLSIPGHANSKCCKVLKWNKTLKHIQVPTRMHLESQNLTVLDWLHCYSQLIQVYYKVVMSTQQLFK